MPADIRNKEVESLLLKYTRRELTSLSSRDPVAPFCTPGFKGSPSKKYQKDQSIK
jgi:hypothetical protein